jgi:hypothetical protein
MAPTKAARSLLSRTQAYETCMSPTRRERARPHGYGEDKTRVVVDQMEPFCGCLLLPRRSYCACSWSTPMSPILSPSLPSNLKLVVGLPEGGGNWTPPFAGPFSLEPFRQRWSARWGLRPLPACPWVGRDRPFVNPAGRLRSLCKCTHCSMHWPLRSKFKFARAYLDEDYCFLSPDPITWIGVNKKIK